MKKVLVIAPHLDDEVLGCGGTMAKLEESGNEVNVVIITNGFVGAPHLYDKESLKKTRNEAVNAHKRLKVNKTIFWDYPATNLRNFQTSRIAESLTDLFSELKPDIIFIPHRGDIHEDHKIVFDCSLVASRPVNQFLIKEIYAYETLSETEWAAPYSSEIFFPTFYNVISENQLSSKIAAMKLYESQVKAHPNPRSVESVINLAKMRGSVINHEFAEAFYIVRKIEN